MCSLVYIRVCIRGLIFISCTLLALLDQTLHYYNTPMLLIILLLLYTGMTEQILCTPQNLDLLKRIQQRYKHSHDVQKNVNDIILNCSHSLESK